MTDDESSPEGGSELYRRHERALARAPGLALQSVRALALPKEISPPNELEGLGDKVVAEAHRKLQELHQKHGALVPRILSLAIRELWYSAWETGHYLRELHSGLPPDDIPSTSKETWKPEWHIARDGWDGCLRNTLYLAEINAERHALLSDVGIEKHPGASSVLIAAATLRFAEASARLVEADVPGATNALHDAYMLLGDEYGLSMWDAAEEEFGQSAEPEPDKAARSALAKLAARARHAPSQAAREEIRARYAAEKATFPHKDAAAQEYTKLYPFEVSTIRDWLKGA